MNSKHHPASRPNCMPAPAIGCTTFCECTSPDRRPCVYHCKIQGENRACIWSKTHISSVIVVIMCVFKQHLWCFCATISRLLRLKSTHNGCFWLLNPPVFFMNSKWRKYNCIVVSSSVWCVKRKGTAVVGIAGSVADTCAMIRRFLADECARAPFEERAGMRIRSVDFFERFRAWGLVLTEWYTIARFGIELSEFLRGLTETDALQCTLKKGRSNEGIYYYVHWAKLQALLESDTDEDGRLVNRNSIQSTSFCLLGFFSALFFVTLSSRTSMLMEGFILDKSTY